PCHPALIACGAGELALRRIAAALLAGIACAPAPAAWAETGTAAAAAAANAPLEVAADSFDYQRDRDLYVARGGLVLRRGERRLSADWVAFSPSTGRGVASGNVVLSDGHDTVHTSFVDFDIDDMRGVMYDARFEAASGQERMEGAEVAKTGEGTYSFRDG